MDFKPLLRKSNESYSDYIKRVKTRYYHHLRKVVPSLREQYRLELLVGPINCWDELIAYQMSLLKDIGLEPHHKFLDIGCGPLAGGLNLIRYLEKYNYVGIDIRPEPIKEARRLISKHKLVDKTPSIIQSETFGKNELDGNYFDFIWVSQLMYHLNKEHTKYLFDIVNSFLKPTGLFVFDIIAESEWKNVPNDSKWQDFSFFFENSEYYISLGNSFNLKGHIHSTLEKYGYPEKEGLKNNEILIFTKNREV